MQFMRLKCFVKVDFVVSDGSIKFCFVFVCAAAVCLCDV